MPEIKQSYQIENVSLDNLYQESLEILKELGAIRIDENTINQKAKELRAIIPSI